MFAKTIIGSDAFLDMPQSTQALYFHLAMRADDDGFVNSPKSIMRLVGCKDDDLKVLSAKKFIIPFESGVIVIKHWRIHNYIAKDRYTETKYKIEKARLSLDENGSYTECIQNVDKPATQVRLGKDSIGKDNKKEEPLPSEAIALSDLIFTLHHDNIDTGYNATEERRKKWAADIEKLNRLDSRSWQDIEAAIRWIKTPGNFWAANILSGSKLREKFPTIWGQMKQRGEVPQEVPRPSLPKETPGPDFMRELVKRHREELEANDG